MKPLSSSVEACRCDVTGHTSAITIAVSREPRLSITCTIFWGTTTTLDLRWLVTKRCSCSGSSSRPMSLKTSKDATGRRTSKTVAICTGTSTSSWTVFTCHLTFTQWAEPSAVACVCRFPTQSPLKSFPARPLLGDSSDLPRLIRWDDYEELPQQENVAPIKSAVLVRKRQRCLTHSSVLPILSRTVWVLTCMDLR